MNEIKNIKFEKRQLIVAGISIIIIIIGVYLLCNNYKFAYKLTESNGLGVTGDLEFEYNLEVLRSYSNMFIFSGSALLLAGVNNLIKSIAEIAKIFE